VIIEITEPVIELKNKVSGKDHMIAGACGGIAGVVAGHPLDTLKVTHIAIFLTPRRASKRLKHRLRLQCKFCATHSKKKG
jgi:hypothetical protein